MSTYTSRFFETWPAPSGRIRIAQKYHSCDHKNAAWFQKTRPFGRHCPRGIRAGEPYFDPGESNPHEAGGFGGYRYCLQCAEITVKAVQ